MWFQVLGPVRAWCGDHEVDLGSPKQRLLCGALLVEVNHFVSVDALSELLWSDDAPSTARRTIQAYLSRLRKSLIRGGCEAYGVALTRRGGGYQLDCDLALVDVHRFQRLVAGARGADDRTAARLLREALDLWQGPLLADVADDDLRDRRWPRLMESRLTALEQLADTELRLGLHERLVEELEVLARQYPYRQRIVGMLMLALHRCGRTAEALRVFDDTRRLLSHEFGIDPSSEIQALHVAILRAEAGADPSTGVPTPPGSDPRDASRHSRPVPAQLPADIADFTGRQASVARLDRLLDAGSTGTGTAMPVAVIAGTAGVGKTALAVHWGHRVRHRFPDGQLYVNLHGFAPEAPAQPVDALAGFLQGLGCSADQIPADVEQAADYYRTLLADRRMLVVLDNARSAGQVRPLLPGSSGCLVVVTSRNQLTGLAAEGAHPLTLDLFTSAEARDLLADRLGADRVRSDPDAVDEIIARCARLPLALAIVAARAGAHPDFALSALASELREVHNGLDHFANGDDATDVRAVFSWSYHTLGATTARLFRLLGLHAGPDIATSTVASLAGVTVSHARRLTAELARAHLVEERTPGRYTLHDLLRAYATELAHELDPAADRRAALHRVFDHYLQTSHAADRLLQPHRDPLVLAPPRPGVSPERLADLPQVVNWFTVELPALLAAVQQAANAGFDTAAWRLAWTLENFLHQHGHWRDWAATQRTALEATHRLGDQRGQAHAHRGLGRAHFRLADYARAHDHLCRALDLYRKVGDLTAEANTHQNLAVVLSRQGRPAEDLSHNQQALALYRAAGHRSGVARTLNNIGWYHTAHGDRELALAYCQQALEVQQETGDRRGQAEAWDSLGYAHHHLGQYTQSLACYREALDLVREFGDLFNEAGVLTRLGDSHHAAGESDDARRVWQHALTILTVLGHPDADQVRATLSRVEAGTDAGQGPPTE